MDSDDLRFITQRDQAMSEHLADFVERHGLSSDRSQWPEDLEAEFFVQRTELESTWYRKADIRAERRRAFTEPPRVAPVFDGREESGRPSHRRPLAKKLQQPLLNYLESAPIIWSEPGFGEDEFAPGEFDVPLNYRTDGAWIWADAVPHYFRKHGFPPARELKRHIIDNEFPSITVDDERRSHAREVVANLRTSEVGVPRLAHVYDGRDADGRPVADRPPVPNEILTPLLTYLESAPIILSARGFDADEFAPGDHDVPLNFHTDGTWIWAGAVPHYLRKHGIPPELALIRHVIDHGFRVAEVDDETTQRALAVITGP
ncbi:hypothetical protein [Nocardia caishijiensis]|uniref:Uncharacterized protein n=1 Tax=Nocardia caishijiensis TaxID=184756 RepID=A0ABQ6YS92_9NOCA|nr:hypothetical protein [Nocardia caishijiensis]KAF0848296.1 hypothetical protein FNL39_102444 [Nocardia caishijiensis]